MHYVYGHTPSELSCHVMMCLVGRQCYGGDVSRKKKLLQKQAKGKKRMKALGKVIVPQEAFQVQLHFLFESHSLLQVSLGYSKRDKHNCSDTEGRHGEAESMCVYVRYVWCGLASQVCLSLKGGKGGGGGE